MPFFSIIIPTLNEERHIGVLLEDLSKQKYQDYEVIIVDGHSTDKTVQIIEDWQQKLNKVSLVKAHKKGVCFQRNQGAETAKGKYLVFLDADVRLYKQYLSSIHSCIKKTSARFITTYQLPDIRNSLDMFLIQVANYTFEMLILINKQMAPEYNFIIDKRIFDSVGGFDEKAVFAEAHELSIRIWKKKRVKLHVIKKNLLKWSFRRLRRDGRLPVIYSYSWAMLHMLVAGKITDIHFKYLQGGEHFNNLEQLGDKNLLARFKREIRRIIELE